jgi:putative membrane protein
MLHRPYVVAFFAAFVVLVWAERGPLRAVLWLVSGTLIGWLAEWCSVTTGVPFGWYVYHQEQFADEPWLGPVPLFASLSFAFMSYFAFSAARRLRVPWHGAGWRLETADPATIDGALRTALFAAAIGTWMDTVVDPLTLLGRHWFLGDLYHYEPPGRHFGVPLVNYAGWFVTIGTVALANQALDRLLARTGLTSARGPRLPLEPFWGVGCCLGVFGFMLAINVGLILRGTAPPEAPLGAVLVSGLVSTGLFVCLVVAKIRRGLSSLPSASRRAPGDDPESPSRSPRPRAR